MAEEESDASEFADIERPPETQWPVWANTVRNAWIALRDDRFYGAMGGVGRIYYSALSQYARDHSIPLEPFATFVMAMDDEYVTIQNAKAQADTTTPTTEDQ